MIRMRTILDIADNTGARRASCIGVIERGDKRYANIGDIITANIKEATPDAIVKKGEVVKAVVVRTKNKIRRGDAVTMVTLKLMAELPVPVVKEEKKVKVEKKVKTAKK